MNNTINIINSINKNYIDKDYIDKDYIDKNDYIIHDEKKQKNDEKSEPFDNVLISKLFGIDINSFNNNNNINNKQLWKVCNYCDKFHGNEFYIPKLEYCIHCWAWFNMNDINLETGKYTGATSFDIVKTFIKKAYTVHLKGFCENKECIFNKITDLAKNKKLNTVFTELLFESEKKEIKQEEKSIAVSINMKNHKLNINFDKSEINI
jgi:hypothetical protein